MYYNAGSTPSFDSYAQFIEAEKSRIAAKEAEVRGKLAEDLEDAETTQNSTYIAYKYTTIDFNTSNTETSNYQKQIQDLKEEMRLAIKMATEEAQAQGKSQDEIDNICWGISTQYLQKIAGIQWHLTKSSGVTSQRQIDRYFAKQQYGEARFGTIFASNNYIDGLRSLALDYHNLGKKQQHFNFLNAQSEGGWQVNYLI